ncbi:MAG: putative transport permease YfiM [Herpetosiphonaceae bacterium]|nr:MAG: putative transport permease YfiM [Herpetosiphonaceae bacterium]
MRKVLNLAWNDIKISFASRSTLIFFLILPILFTTIIGSSLQASDDQRYALVVVDEDNSEFSAALRSTLEQSQVVRPTLLSREEADRRLESRRTRFVLIIPAGFGESLAAGRPIALRFRHLDNDGGALPVEQGITAAADQISSVALAANASLTEAERLRPFASAEERASYFQESLRRMEALIEPPPVVARFSGGAQSRLVANGFEQSSPGQLVTWVLITLLGAAEVLVNERRAGTLRRLVVTPTRKATILMGKIVGRLSMGLLQIALLIGFGALALGVDWGSSPSALVVMVLSFALAAVALGLMLGTFTKTRAQAAGLTVLFSLLLSALGGAWWPLEITPEAYQNAVQVLPTTWAMRGFTDVIVRGQDLSGVLLESGVLLGFAVLFFLIGVVRFRFE